MSKVSELIDPITGDWDKALVQDVFLEEDMNHILAIPVNSNMDDSIAWHYDTKGLFSIKSMYHTLEDNRERRATIHNDDTSAPTTIANQEVWGNLWKLECPPKIKQFL